MISQNNKCSDLYFIDEYKPTSKKVKVKVRKDSKGLLCSAKGELNYLVGDRILHVILISLTLIVSSSESKEHSATKSIVGLSTFSNFYKFFSISDHKFFLYMFINFDINRQNFESVVHNFLTEKRNT